MSHGAYTVVEKVKVAHLKPLESHQVNHGYSFPMAAVTVPQTAWLTTQQFVLSQFWMLQVSNKGVGCIPSRVVGKNLFYLSPNFWVLPAILGFPWLVAASLQFLLHLQSVPE